MTLSLENAVRVGLCLESLQNVAGAGNNEPVRQATQATPEPVPVPVPTQLSTGRRIKSRLLHFPRRVLGKATCRILAFFARSVDHSQTSVLVGGLYQRMDLIQEKLDRLLQFRDSTIVAQRDMAAINVQNTTHLQATQVSLSRLAGLTSEIARDIAALQAKTKTGAVSS